MAITVPQITGGNNKTAGTSLSIPVGSTIEVGNIAVLVLCTDNSGTSGAAPTISAISGPGDNTWTLRDSDNRTPGSTALDGASLFIYECTVTTQMTSAQNISVTLSPSTTAKAWVIIEIAGAEGGFSASDTVTSSTGGTAITTPLVASGDLVIGIVAGESTWFHTGDTDTTNGSWSSPVRGITSGGQGATNVQANAEYKIVTAAGAQTFDSITGNNDHIVAYLVYAVAPTGPPAQSVDLSPQTVTTSTVSLTITVGEVIINLSSLTLTVTPVVLAPPQAITLVAQTITASPQSLTISAGAVSTELTVQVVNTTAIALTSVVGTVTIQLTPQTITESPQALTTTVGAVSINLSSQTLTMSPQALTITTGAVSTELASQSVTTSAIALNVTLSTIINAVSQTATVSAVALTITTGPVVVSLVAQTATTAAQPLTVQPGAVAISLASHAVTASSGALSITPGAVAVDLIPISLTVQTVALLPPRVVELTSISIIVTQTTLTIGTGPISIDLSIVTMAVSTRPLSPNLGATVPGPPESLTATPGNAQVFLDWEPATSGDPATDYIVQYRVKI